MLKQIIPPVMLLIVIFVGIPKAADLMRDEMQCKATPELIDKVMSDLLPADSQFDRTEIKSKLLTSLSKTTDCQEMIKVIRTEILNRSLPEELQAKEGEERLIFKSDKEALEHARKNWY